MQHVDTSFNICLKNESKTINMYVKECSFVSNTWKTFQIKMSLTFLNVNFWRYGSTVPRDKMLPVRVSQLLLIKKHQKYQICVMDFVISHQGINFHSNWQVCDKACLLIEVFLLAPFHLMT